MEERYKFLEAYEKIFIMSFAKRIVTRKNIEKIFETCKSEKDNSEQMDIWLNDIKHTLLAKLNDGKNVFSVSEITTLIKNCIGQDIRDFDMSKIINKDNIKSVTPVQKDKQLIYEDSKLRITRLGELQYSTISGVESLAGLDYYIIEKILKNGKTETFKVFSQINTMLMQDDESYRDAVIYTLLDSNNIRKSNCYGYIGSIQNIAVNNKIKANERYSLVFDNDDASAVAKLAEQTKPEPTSDREAER